MSAVREEGGGRGLRTKPGALGHLVHHPQSNSFIRSPSLVIRRILFKQQRQASSQTQDILPQVNGSRVCSQEREGVVLPYCCDKRRVVCCVDQ